ncbi:MAG: D-alanyl-D-alanine carboxypeptidase family protein [Thiotrichaceae bacterium]
MIKLRNKILSVVMVSFFLTSVVHAAQNSPLIKLPDIDAESYLLIDFHSQRILASKNPGKKIEPASITKLMSAYVIYKELYKGNVDTKDLVLISEKAWRMKGSRMFVEARKKVPMERLLSGLIIQSGNDAAIALAEHISGTEASFVEKMNAEAVRLGLNNTHFVNVTGWPAENHFTTAHDIATLTRAVISEFPEHYKLYKKREYSYNGIKQYNRNKLLWLDPTVDGVKTGHTKSAGFCLVASADRNGMRLISVVLGAKSVKERSDASQQLLEYGYKNFETRKLYEGGGVLENVRIWKGASENMPIGFIDDFYITVPKGSYERLSGIVEYQSDVDAPVHRGDEVGKVIIKDGDKVVVESPLVALNTIAGGGLWRKMTDGLEKVFH